MEKLELHERLDKALCSAGLSYLANSVPDLNNPFDYLQLIERILNISIYRGINYEELAPYMLSVVESICTILSLWGEEDQYD